MAFSFRAVWSGGETLRGRGFSLYPSSNVHPQSNGQRRGIHHQENHSWISERGGLRINPHWKWRRPRICSQRTNHRARKRNLCDGDPIGTAHSCCGTLRPRLLRRCSNNTLKGTFTSIAQGFDRVGTGTNIQWLPIGKIGDEQFNGQGCSAYKESIKQGANFSEAEGLLTYKVLEDCTFEMLDQGKPAFFGVIVNGGQVMPYLKLVDGAVRLGEYTRINSSSTPLKCP